MSKCLTDLLKLKIVSSIKKCNFWSKKNKELKRKLFSGKRGPPSLPDGKIGIFAAPSKSYIR